MGESHEQAKRLLRQRVRAIRLGLRAEEIARCSTAVSARLLELRLYTAARRVVAYAAVDNEVDPGGIAVAAARAGKMVYYPRMTEDGVEFARADPAELRPGWRGIPEPPAREPLALPGDGVLFLVPGVAFDPRGARLGRGLGCYDRALARYPGAARVGLAYEFQVEPHLPEATWDIRMHAIVTEARVLEGARGPVGQ